MKKAIGSDCTGTAECVEHNHFKCFPQTNFITPNNRELKPLRRFQRDSSTLHNILLPSSARLPKRCGK